jgi:hypothetical protein
MIIPGRRRRMVISPEGNDRFWSWWVFRDQRFENYLMLAWSIEHIFKILLATHFFTEASANRFLYVAYGESGWFYKPCSGTICPTLFLASQSQIVNSMISSIVFYVLDCKRIRLIHHKLFGNETIYETHSMLDPDWTTAIWFELSLTIRLVLMFSIWFWDTLLVPKSVSSESAERSISNTAVGWNWARSQAETLHVARVSR